MTPATVKLNDHWAGDTWMALTPGLIIGPIQINTGTVEAPILSAPPNPVASCLLQFKNQGGAVGYELSSVDTTGKGSIAIDDAATWIFTVPPQDLPLSDGKWPWSFKCVDSLGTEMTFYKGTLTVNP
jgi:hypothetical protein